MDVPREHYAKGNKPVRERQVLYDFTYVWNLMKKKKLTNKIERDWYTEQTDNSQREGGLGVSMKMVKGLSREKTHNHRQQYGD